MSTITENRPSANGALPKALIGGRRRADLRGKKFNLLTVVSFAGSDHSGSLWECECECGSSKIVRGANLSSGITGSCGCRRPAHLNGHQSTLDRQSDSPLFQVWRGMLDRCTNPNSDGWGSYGGRGIAVSPEWMTFANFSSDMSPRPEGYQIDRIDNNLGYSLANCRWVTASENCRNRRDNVLVSYAGREITVAEASELSGIPRYVLYARINSNNQNIFRPVDSAKGAHNKNNRNWEKRVRSGRQKIVSTAAKEAQA